MPFTRLSPSPVPWPGTASGHRAGFMWQRCFIQVWGSVEEVGGGIFRRPQQDDLGGIPEPERETEQQSFRFHKKRFLLNKLTPGKKELPQALPTALPDSSGPP